MPDDPVLTRRLCELGLELLGPARRLDALDEGHREQDLHDDAVRDAAALLRGGPELHAQKPISASTQPSTA